MRILSYLLIAVLLTGCTSVFGQEARPKVTPEQVREIIREAEQGDAEAQTALGLVYEKGEGVPQDHQLAVKWYKLAAEQGVSMSMLNIYSILRPLSMPQLEGVPWRIRSR